MQMEDKEAIKILTQMLANQLLTAKERQAIETAIGILSWSTLGQGMIKRIAKSHKAKRENDLQV